MPVVRFNERWPKPQLSKVFNVFSKASGAATLCALAVRPMAGLPRLELATAKARQAQIETLVVEMEEPTAGMDVACEELRKAIYHYEGFLSSVALYRGHAPESGLFLVLDYKRPVGTAAANTKRAMDFVDAIKWPTEREQFDRLRARKTPKGEPVVEPMCRMYQRFLDMGDAYAAFRFAGEEPGAFSSSSATAVLKAVPALQQHAEELAGWHTEGFLRTILVDVPHGARLRPPLRSQRGRTAAVLFQLQVGSRPAVVPVHLLRAAGQGGVCVHCAALHRAGLPGMRSGLQARPLGERPVRQV